MPLWGRLLAVIPALQLAFMVVVVAFDGIRFDDIFFFIQPALLSILILVPAYLIADPRLLNSEKLSHRSIWLYCLLPAAILTAMSVVDCLTNMSAPEPLPEAYLSGIVDPEYGDDRLDYSMTRFFGYCIISIRIFSWIIAAIGFWVFVKRDPNDDIEE